MYLRKAAAALVLLDKATVKERRERKGQKDVEEREMSGQWIGTFERWNGTVGDRRTSGVGETRKLN